MRSVAENDKSPGTTRAAVAELMAQGLYQAQIARELGISKPTVCFHMRMLGIPPHEDFARRYDWDEIRAYYDAGHSVRDCVRAFGFSTWSWHDAVQRGAITPRPAFRPLDEVFAVGTRRNRGHLKSRLLLAGIKESRCERCGIHGTFNVQCHQGLPQRPTGRLLAEGLKEPQCERCGLTEWQGQDLSLELHHVNGDGRDNRLENLMLLCPNCHSQTDSWGGRNKGRRAA